MNKNIYAYLDEIDKRNGAIVDTSHTIKEKTEKFNRDIEPYYENIRRHNAEISAIKGMPISAELSDIVKHMAEMWGVSADKLKVSYSTDWNFETISLDYANKNAENFNADKDTSTNIMSFSFVITKPKENENDTLMYQTINLSLPLDSVQKDGKTFGQHLKAKVSQINKRLPYKVELSIDDLQQMILKFKLNELITDSSAGIVPKSDTARAVLDASEDYRVNQQEMVD